MAFPDVSDVLDCFLESVIHKRVTVINNADYKRETSTVDTVRQAVVQNARPEDLNLDNLDWSLEYIRVHSKFELLVNDIINWNGKDFKIISPINQGNRGFWEMVGEEIK